MEPKPTKDDFSLKSEEAPLKVYTDGSCMTKGNTSVAGYGVYAKSRIQTVQISEPLPDAVQTSQRAEVKALQSALEVVWALRPRKAIIYTDSEYATNGFNNWMNTWKQSKWIKSDGSAVAHADLWGSILEYADGCTLSVRGISVSVVWVARDSCDGQRHADYLARLGCSLHQICNLCRRALGRNATQHLCRPFCSIGSCKGSERQFHDVDAYNKHVAACHSVTVSCRLPSCPATFGSYEARASHERGAHRGYVFECDYCYHVSQGVEEKMEHEREECEAAPYCRACSRWFKSTRARDQHMDAVHRYSAWGGYDTDESV